jgi:hypothetical protein
MRAYRVVAHLNIQVVPAKKLGAIAFKGRNSDSFGSQ